MVLIASIIALFCIECMIIYDLIVANRRFRMIDLMGLFVYGCMFLTFLRVFGIL